jgi:hypothetical protein
VSTILKVTLMSFIIATILSFFLCLLFYPWAQSLFLSFVLGSLYALFAFGFSIRTLKRVSFIINTQNKKADVGLIWYQEKIIEQAKDMRFILKEHSHDKIVFKPQSLYQVFESEIVLEISAYDLKLTCSRMMMRIILDYLELELRD